MKVLLAEFLGTFAMVFAGTGAIVADHFSGGGVGNTGIALVFGLILLAMICAFGDVSGAHLNPAVSCALAFAGRFSWRSVPGYALAQLAGAFAASGLLRHLFPADPTLGATLPHAGIWQTFLVEVGLTAMLVQIVLMVAGKGSLVPPIAIGSVVTLEAIFAGPFTGASMNPARSLAPAIVAGHFQHLWLYPAASLLGAALTVPLCSCVCGGNCCRVMPNKSLL